MRIVWLWETRTGMGTRTNIVWLSRWEGDSRFVAWLGTWLMRMALVLIANFVITYSRRQPPFLTSWFGSWVDLFVLRYGQINSFHLTDANWKIWRCVTEPLSFIYYDRYAMLKLPSSRPSDVRSERLDLTILKTFRSMIFATISFQICVHLSFSF